MSDPFVSVVIPAYNASQYLDAAIKSVLSQNFINLECVVIDDGSVDSTPAIAKTFAKVRYHRIERAGVASARNAGLALANGDLIAFLDADDLWLPDKLSSQVAELKSDPSLALVYTGCHVIDERGRFRGRVYPPPAEELVYRLGLIESQGIALGSTALIRKRMLIEVGGFDESMSTAADWDLAFRIACQHPVSRLRAPLVLYRRHATQMHSDPSATKRDLERFLEKMLSERASPPELRDKFQRSRANLNITLAGRYRLLGDWRGFMRHTLAAFRRPNRVAAAIYRLSSDPNVADR